jgi:hypothetical protein
MCRSTLKTASPPLTGGGVSEKEAWLAIPDARLCESNARVTARSTPLSENRRTMAQKRNAISLGTGTFAHHDESQQFFGSVLMAVDRRFIVTATANCTIAMPSAFSCRLWPYSYVLERENVVAQSAVTKCSACGSAYGPAQWSALPLVRRLDPGELLSFVNPWPAHLVVEARACASCGRAMSRVNHAVPAAGG